MCVTLNTVEPLFPRYLFIRVDPARCSTAPVRSTRGVSGLVRHCGLPAVANQPPATTNSLSSLPSA